MGNKKPFYIKKENNRKTQMSTNECLTQLNSIKKVLF